MTPRAVFPWCGSAEWPSARTRYRFRSAPVTVPCGCLAPNPPLRYAGVLRVSSHFRRARVTVPGTGTWRERTGHAQTWRFGRELDAVGELDAGPRVFREEQVAVEVDVVAEARDLAAGRDAEPGLDHAPEHHAEAERPGRVRPPNRPADPPRI